MAEIVAGNFEHVGSISTGAVGSTVLRSRLEEQTLKYWQASFAWNTSSHRKSKMTVAQGICLLDEARRGSQRLQQLADITINQIVHKQAEVVSITKATVKEIRG